MDNPEIAVVGSKWNRLYTISGVAAIVLLAYALATMVLLLVIGGQPETAQEGFTMLRENRALGLLRLDVLTILVMPLYYPLFLGFYLALEKTHAAYAALAALLAFAGVTLFLATPSAFSWLALSDKFAAATSVERKTQLLAAGEAMLACDMWHSSGAIVGGILGEIAATLISVVMLWNSAFGKATAYTGIATHGLELIHILVAFFLPAAGFVLMAIAGPLYLVWFPLLAQDFFRLANSAREAPRTQSK